MTPLRHQMIEEMQLRGYAQSTIESYVHVVAQLARHYHRSPDQLEEGEVRRYLLHLAVDKKIARGSFSVVLGASASSSSKCSAAVGRTSMSPSRAWKKSSPWC